jgi:hypothetical protein
MHSTEITPQKRIRERTFAAPEADLSAAGFLPTLRLRGSCRNLAEFYSSSREEG